MIKAELMSLTGIEQKRENYEGAETIGRFPFRFKELSALRCPSRRRC